MGSVGVMANAQIVLQFSPELTVTMVLVCDVTCPLLPLFLRIQGQSFWRRQNNCFFPPFLCHWVGTLRWEGIGGAMFVSLYLFSTGKHGCGVVFVDSDSFPTWIFCFGCCCCWFFTLFYFCPCLVSPLFPPSISLSLSLSHSFTLFLILLILSMVPALPAIYFNGWTLRQQNYWTEFTWPPSYCQLQCRYIHVAIASS